MLTVFRRLTDLMRGPQPRDLAPPANAASRVQRFVGVACLTALTLIAPPERADALGGEVATTINIGGSCFVDRAHRSVYAGVGLHDGTGWRYVDGKQFNGDNFVFVQSSQTALTADRLLRCGFTDVTNFVTTSPTASTIASAEFYGFSFRATRNGLTSDYSYGLRGVTNTVAENNVTPVNRPPVITEIPPVNVNSGAQATVTVTATDPDSDPLTYNWALAQPQLEDIGATNIVAVANTLTFTAPTLGATDQARTKQTSVGVSDGKNGQQLGQIYITVNRPPNTLPTANAGTDLIVQSGATVELEGGASDLDGDTLTYDWSLDNDLPPPLANTGLNPFLFAPTLKLNADDLVLTAMLTVTDSKGAKATDTVQITVESPKNAKPVANAGTDLIVQSGATVNLTGTASDTDVGDTLTYDWYVNNGQLPQPRTSLTPSFTAPTLSINADDTVLTATLTVKDSKGGETTDTVQITVQSPKNATPVANAGLPQTVQSGATVTLTGSGTDADAGDTLTYSWADPVFDPDEDPITITNPTSASASFTAPILPLDGPDAEIPVTLTVSDGKGGTDESTVTITVVAPKNTPPTANAGPDQIVQSGDLVTLSGEAGDAESPRYSIYYYWTIKSDTPPAPQLMDDQRLTPSFTAPVLAVNAPDLVLTATITVMDGNYISTTDDVIITVQSPKNANPVAKAGPPQTVQSGAVVNLSGMANDKDDDALSYTWSLPDDTPFAKISINNSTSLSASFTAPVLPLDENNLDIPVTLTVRDGKGGMDRSTVIITVEAPTNTLPTANAGEDQIVQSGAVVNLLGQADDAESPNDLRYFWSRSDERNLTNSDTLTPSFTAPVLAINADDEKVAVTLQVYDANMGLAEDTVVITVQSQKNVGPSANAGTPQTVSSGGLVTLSGTASDKDKDDKLSYLWTVPNSGDLGPISITNPTSLTPSFTAPLVNLNSNNVIVPVTLTVTDLVGVQAISTVNITVLSKANVMPTAAPSSAVTGQTVTLLANATDADQGDSEKLTYSWRQIAGRAVTLSANTVANPTFALPSFAWSDQDAEMRFEVTVTDDDGMSVMQQVAVMSNLPARPSLTVDIGADRSVKTGERVALNAQVSGDVASTKTYLWTTTGGTLENSTSATATFVAPDVAASTDFVVTLTLTETFQNYQPLVTSDTMTITVGRAGPTGGQTVAVVTEFAQTRINNLIALQPDLLSIIGGGDGTANLTVSSRGGQVDLSTAPDADVWARLKGNWSTVDASKSDYVLGSIGTHTTYANGMVLGAMAQIDHMETTNGNASMTGTGYLVGPYFVSKFADQPVTMQGRLLYGKSQNEYSPLGTFVDKFDSTRLMGQFGISGQIHQGTTA